jgi:hypothetical protein
VRFLRRAAIGLLFAFVAFFIPCANWTPDVFANWQVPIVVLALILYMGVLIVDTLFYDRYD